MGTKTAILSCLIFIFGTFLCSLVAQSYEWSNKEGMSIRAKFIGMDGSFAILEKADGRRFKYSISHLSQESVQQLNELLKNVPTVSNLDAIPPLFRARVSKTSREALVKKFGGSPEVEKAVVKGLDWLVANQDKQTGSLGDEYQAAMTGLALLAWLGHGETPESPRYGDSIVKGALYLMDRAIKNRGLMTNGQEGHHESYEHGIATLALAELYILTKESGKEIPRLESVLKKSIGLITDGQTDIGGWLYGYRESKDSGDTCLSGWQMLVLHTSEFTGKKFSGISSCFDKGIKFFEGMQTADGSIKYTPPGDTGKLSLTGISQYLFQLCGQTDSPTYIKGRDYMSKSPISASSDLYAPFFDISWRMHDSGSDLDVVNSAVNRLTARQNADGAWPGTSRNEDGVYMNTALAILILESYYRYDFDVAK